MRISAGTIVGVIIALIMITVLLKILPTTIPTAATAYHNLTDDMAADTDVYGTDASAFAGDLDDLLGWFWVFSPFVLTLGVVLGVFLKRRG